jgi:hypothetical protein
MDAQCPAAEVAAHPSPRVFPPGASLASMMKREVPVSAILYGSWRVLGPSKSMLRAQIEIRALGVLIAFLPYRQGGPCSTMASKGSPRAPPGPGLGPGPGAGAGGAGGGMPAGGGGGRVKVCVWQVLITCDSAARQQRKQLVRFGAFSRQAWHTAQIAAALCRNPRTVLTTGY